MLYFQNLQLNKNLFNSILKKNTCSLRATAASRNVSGESDKLAAPSTVGQLILLRKSSCS
ncbi:hypothetical protein HanIR_Chr14g0702451 [Helianthus annuus]|nr:hypothetical protein HanIR_Chr14g0702451 [Helianthus annuus]